LGGKKEGGFIASSGIIPPHRGGDLLDEEIPDGPTKGDWASQVGEPTKVVFGETRFSRRERRITHRGPT